METISFKVAQFDAPLDLILHLIVRHKLSISDIDITSLMDQYMATINEWQNQSMEIASEFLEMASRLVYMKTVSLLPRHEEESDRLKKDFAGELMEYHMCKIAAEKLRETMSFDSFVRESVKFDIDPTYNGNHESIILYEALLDAIGRGARKLPPPRESFDPIVTRPFVSVTSKIFTVLRSLRRKDFLSLDELFDLNSDKSSMVATFLAVLELIKSKKIYLNNNGQVALGRAEQ